jgi:putative spermidine/putrescine transport system permease protein
MDAGHRRPYWILFVGPYGLYLIVLLIVPFTNVALLSMYTYSPTEIAVPELTTANYLRLWDFYYIALFVRTMKLGLITTIVCAALCYPLAYFLARAGPRVTTLGLFLIITPLMVSTVIRVFGWIVILGREGLVNKGLRLLGFEGVGILYTETAVIIGLVQLFTPFMVLPLMASIERIPVTLEEAAQNLGANWYQMFARTILPLSLPGLISGSLLVYSVAISAFVTPALMGGAKVRMVGQQIYDDVLASFNWPGASALALVLVALTLVLLFLALAATRRMGHLSMGGGR